MLKKVSKLDFDFHHLVAISSGNHIYPLLLNSFKHGYINLAGQLFVDSTLVPEVFGFHKTIFFYLRRNKNDRYHTSEI